MYNVSILKPKIVKLNGAHNLSMLIAFLIKKNKPIALRIIPKRCVMTFKVLL